MPNGLELLLLAGQENAARQGYPLARAPSYVGAPIVTTPAEINARLERLNAEAQNLNASIYRATTAAILANAPGADEGRAFRDAWARELGAWETFYRDNAPRWKRNVMGVLFPPALLLEMSKIGPMIDAWRARVVQWDQDFRRRYPAGAVGPGGTVAPGGGIGPAIMTNAEEADVTQVERQSVPGSTFPWWATSILTLAALGGTAYLGYATYKYVTEAKKDVDFVRREVVPAVTRRGLGGATRDPARGTEGGWRETTEHAAGATWPPL